MGKRQQAVQERRALALRMRREGATYAEVVEAIPAYKSESAASRDVSRALETMVAEEGKALLALHRERTEALWASVWPLAAAGDVRAIREATRVLERASRLLGVDRAAGSAVESSDLAASTAYAHSLAGGIVAMYEATRGEQPDTDPDD